jgi:hypothetical protein
MAQRLYHVGLPNDIHGRSKSEEIDQNSLPISLQHVELVHQRFGQPYRVVRQLSSPALILSRQSIYRNNINPPLRLSLHIQSMKKSAFKMLCKFILSYRKLELAVDLKHIRTCTIIVRYGTLKSR